MVTMAMTVLSLRTRRLPRPRGEGDGPGSAPVAVRRRPVVVVPRMTSDRTDGPGSAADGPRTGPGARDARPPAAGLRDLGRGVRKDGPARRPRTRAGHGREGSRVRAREVSRVRSRRGPHATASATLSRSHRPFRAGTPKSPRQECCAHHPGHGRRRGGDGRCGTPGPGTAGEPHGRAGTTGGLAPCASRSLTCGPGAA